MIGRKEEVHLNIYPTKYSCKIIFFKQDKNKIEILSEVDKKISMDNRVFIEKGAREEYIDEISNYILNEELKYSKCKSIFINIQENDIILKNIKIDSDIKQKAIIKAVDIEIKEFCNNSISNYCIDYKKVYNDGVDTEVQVVLFPKKYIDLFSEICDRIGIEKRAMHTNFNLLERLIKKNGVKVMNSLEFGVVEFREKDLVISIFSDGVIKSSYVIKKGEFTQEIGESIFGNCESILTLGDKGIEDIKLVQEFSKIMDIDFGNDIEYTKNYKRVSSKEYFNITAKRIN
ncbi:hypothetical protein [Peptoclostridium sp. AF21-18]|uniref:hypothetical protein n=1 Tax=Peptoclostridium sp. AF21-18 TaxID=2292243 RepID=UPI000E4BB593|nr:hypothetical protein [Peptoclostridium sp. AF21-18]RHQ96424.1 hypothetical protein DWX74_08240 [Peptoclostridium sp. AF21-18]